MAGGRGSRRTAKRVVRRRLAERTSGYQSQAIVGPSTRRSGSDCAMCRSRSSQPRPDSRLRTAPVFAVARSHPPEALGSAPQSRLSQPRECSVELTPPDKNACSDKSGEVRILACARFGVTPGGTRARDPAGNAPRPRREHTQQGPQNPVPDERRRERRGQRRKARPSTSIERTGRRGWRFTDFHVADRPKGLNPGRARRSTDRDVCGEPKKTLMDELRALRYFGCSW
jgi:hypothetical protein